MLVTLPRSPLASVAKGPHVSHKQQIKCDQPRDETREGITYEEKKLQQKAAHNHAKAITAKTARGRRNAEAKALKCDEKLAKFEEARKMKPLYQ